MLTVLCLLFCALACSFTACSTANQTPSTDGNIPAFTRLLKGRCLDRSGNPVDVNSDYYLIYYAADWCPYCREFETELKKTYDLVRRMYANVQIVFAGHVNDTGNDNLISFLEQGDYDFPYVRYECREETGIMNLVDVPKFWIPGFVLVDENGTVLSSSNGQTKEEYSYTRPLEYYQSLQQCDCVGK